MPRQPRAWWIRGFLIPTRQSLSQAALLSRCVAGVRRRCPALGCSGSLGLLRRCRQEGHQAHTGDCTDSDFASSTNQMPTSTLYNTGAAHLWGRLSAPVSHYMFIAFIRSYAQVVLTKPMPNLGKEGTLVAVRNGYFRNYLLPQGYAKVADEQILACVPAPAPAGSADVIPFPVLTFLASLLHPAPRWWCDPLALESNCPSAQRHQGEEGC